MSKASKTAAVDPNAGAPKMSRKERKKLEYIKYAMEKKEQEQWEEQEKLEKDYSKDAAEKQSKSTDLSSTDNSKTSKPKKVVADVKKPAEVIQEENKKLREDVQRLKKEIEEIRLKQHLAIEEETREINASIELKEKQFIEIEEINKQKQAHFQTQTRNLTQEKDDALRDKSELENTYNTKVHGYADTLREVSLRLLEHEKTIDELKKERNNLKEIAFDLMEERNKLNHNDDEEPQHRGEVTEEIRTLIKFANEQIRTLNEEIEKYKEAEVKED